MRDIVLGVWRFAYPTLQARVPQQWVEFVDDNLLVLGSGATLFLSLVLWANV